MNITILRAPALAALALLLASPAAAAQPQPLLQPAPGATASYHFDLNGAFWNGARADVSRNVTITVGDAGAVRIVSTGRTHDDDKSGNGTLAKDGTIAAPGIGDRVRSFNTVVALLRAVPASLKPGTAFDAAIPMAYSDGDATFDLPVRLTVASSDATGTVLQGTGAQSLTGNYSGYSVPIDVSVRFAVKLDGARFARCDFAVDEVVHAGPQTQTMHWTWAMTPVAPANG
ncbi:MAG TPA: hypothetical protein VK669_04500 [Candidatus Limnocylindrales bacterium]|nr:hypothetical protein [Candidatus Limnocylindrales bacterium]